MTDVYVIRNQHGHFWGKSKTWVSGADAKTVMRVPHEDQAVNSLFELSSKDIELRGEVVTAALSERREPMVTASSIPLPELDPTPAMEPTANNAVESDVQSTATAT